MDFRYVNLKNLRKLESLSAENTYDRFRERRERMPAEHNHAEVSKLLQDLDENWNPLAELAIGKVEDAAQKLEDELDERYTRYRKLLAEKSLLMAETSKQSTAARAAIRRIEDAECRMNMRDRAALTRERLSQKRTLGRMEHNANMLRRWDESELCMNERRSQLRRMMGLAPGAAERYENAFARRMMWARFGRTYYADYNRKKEMAEGGVTPVSAGGAYIIRVNVKSVATPMDDADYFGDGGLIAGYFALMDYMPEITRLIRRGMSVDEILSDPEMKARAAELITNAYPVTVARTGGEIVGKYQAMDIESQRRIVIARLFGVDLVPVRVDTTLRESGR